MRMLSNRTLTIGFALLALVWIAALTSVKMLGIDTALPAVSLKIAALPESAFSGKRAMQDIAMQLSFGRRSFGTEGHGKTIAFIKENLAKTPAQVEVQEWRHQQHELTNIIARFHPGNPRRIIIATHYDSIVRAYRDKQQPDAPMPGANNSASGVALLLETARALASMPEPPVGIDFVFFDGEEGAKSLGEGDKEWTALGSPYFAARLEEFYPRQKPEAAAVFDMVCYRKLLLKPELFSLRSARMEVAEFWHIGRMNAPSVFTEQATAFPIGDDHLALQEAGIPSFLVIGFDYEPWYNTTQDTLDKCDPAVLEAVGRTLLQYVYSR